MKKLGNYHAEKFALTAVKIGTVSKGTRNLWLLQSVAIGEPQQIALEWIDVVNLRSFLDEVIKEERGEAIAADINE